MLEGESVGSRGVDPGVLSATNGKTITPSGERTSRGNGDC